MLKAEPEARNAEAEACNAEAEGCYMEKLVPQGIRPTDG
jgi:hypothetical protein